MRVAVMVACFNRRDLTLRFLSAMRTLVDTSDIDISIYLLDDASPDKTGDAVAQQFPEVHIIQGTGDLYWNGGMCAAFARAKLDGPFDAYLLANDDVHLDTAACLKLLNNFITRNQGRESIALVGATTSSSAPDQITYGGFLRGSRWRAMQFSPVGISSGGEDLKCDTFNANFVIVPGPQFEKLGGLDSCYRHGMGDLDLGLSLQRNLVQSFVFNEPVGICDKGPGLNERIGRLPRSERLKVLTYGPHGLRPYLHFISKNGNRWLAPLYMAQTIVKRAIQVARPVVRENSSEWKNNG